MTLRYVFIGILMVAAAAGIGLWQREHTPSVPADIRMLDADPRCDLRRQRCALSLPGGGEVLLDISPRGVPPMEPLQLEVLVAGSPLDAVWVDFAGVDMDMGFNRAGLDAAAAGRFTGSGMIPVCIRDRMTWEARVVLTDGTDWVGAPFRFDVMRAGFPADGGTSNGD
jgi:hypothetical protein